MPNQAAAMTFVWNEQYGMTVAPPAIEWVTGQALNCGANNAGWVSHAYSPPLCVAGLSNWEPFDALVAWPPGAEFSTTAFAHELCHLRDGVLTNGQDLDSNHTGECFVSGGLVEKADAALAEVGL
jgi:hypothetical protein